MFASIACSMFSSSLDAQKSRSLERLASASSSGMFCGTYSSKVAETAVNGVLDSCNRASNCCSKALAGLRFMLSVGLIQSEGGAWLSYSRAWMTVYAMLSRRLPKHWEVSVAKACSSACE